MKSGRSLVNLAQELERQIGSKQDLVVPSSLLKCSTDQGGTLKMSIEGRGGDGAFGVTNLARRQLAEKLKIPFMYFERMRTEQPGLLDRNVNTWLQTDGERRMIRTLDGQVARCCPTATAAWTTSILPKTYCRSCSGFPRHASNRSN